MKILFVLLLVKHISKKVNNYSEDLINFCLDELRKIKIKHRFADTIVDFCKNEMTEVHDLFTLALGYIQRFNKDKINNNFIIHSFINFNVLDIIL